MHDAQQGTIVTPGAQARRTWRVVGFALAALVTFLLFVYAWRVASARLTADVLLGWSSRFMAAVLVSATASWFLATVRGHGPRLASLAKKPIESAASCVAPEPRPRGDAGAVLVFEPACPPRRVLLAEGECVIGSAPGCEIRLEHSGLAPRHCLLETLPGQPLRVRDLGSREGTRLDGRPVTGDWAAFRAGQTLSLGTARIEAVS